jgi:hypothetical protein
MHALENPDMTRVTLGPSLTARRASSLLPAAQPSSPGQSVDVFEPAAAAGLNGALHAGAPAALRVLSSAAMRLQNGETIDSVLRGGARLMIASPELMVAFHKMIPVLAGAIERKVGPGAAGVLSTTLNAAGTGETLTTLHAFAEAVGGTAGRALSLAAVKGWTTGGLWFAAAEVAAAAVQLAADHLDDREPAGRALRKLMPIVGNAAALLTVGEAARGVVLAFRDPSATSTQRLGKVLQLVATVGCCHVDAELVLQRVSDGAHSVRPE